MRGHSTVKVLCRRDIRKLIFISVQKFYFWPHFIYHPTWPSGLRLHLIICRSPVRILATPFVFLIASLSTRSKELLRHYQPSRHLPDLKHIMSCLTRIDTIVSNWIILIKVKSKHVQKVKNLNKNKYKFSYVSPT